ncbi:MAG: hypothetical protein KJ058_00540 [Thermoanaerobaculia bacterium]|nr:hypothetical protein [Thermoanaerobaculia bacterium]
MRTLLATLTIAAALTLTGAAQAADYPKVKKGCHTAWCEKVRTTVKISKRIDRALTRYGSPMAGHGLAITRAVRREGRNPFLILAISGAESSFAKQACAGTFVTTGLGQCWRAWQRIELCGKWIHGPNYVTSWARGLGLTARLIRCRLPNADTVYDLHGYCVACPTWASDIERIARQWFRSGPGVRWRHALEAVGR